MALVEDCFFLGGFYFCLLVFKQNYLKTTGLNLTESTVKSNVSKNEECPEEQSHGSWETNLR